MPWILLLLISLFSAPSFAVAIPGVTTGTTASQQSTPPPEPDVEQKKAAYGALADVLENDASRKELIDQLRKAAATPPKARRPKGVMDGFLAGWGSPKNRSLLYWLTASLQAA